MAEHFVRVRPAPTEDYLANPHKGCCTFQHFNGDELFPGTTWSEAGPVEFPPLRRPGLPSGEPVLTVKGYLPTTVAYCRWFSELMEPEKSRFDFSVIEKSLAVCEQRGQRLAFRAMAFGAPGQPPVPTWYSDTCPMEPYRDSDFLVPRPNSPEYLSHWGDFVRELGRRFDGHPLVENYTCAFVGPWGKGDDVRTWLPGDACPRRSVPLPAGLRRGLVELSAGLIDGQTQQAAVRFANRPRFKDRWLLLGKLDVV